VTGVVDSAPRVTVHVFPDTLVTRIISEELAISASATWNCDTPVDADGKAEEEVTVHVSTVPDAGASVPPLATVVDG
jgi:hypothetical protein